MTDLVCINYMKQNVPLKPDSNYTNDTFPVNVIYSPLLGYTQLNSVLVSDGLFSIVKVPLQRSC